MEQCSPSSPPARLSTTEAPRRSDPDHVELAKTEVAKPPEVDPAKVTPVKSLSNRTLAMVDYYSTAQQPYYQPVCDYTQPEEEWDRDALLDPAWEKQQKKTFTAWANSHLRKAGTNIQIIEEDFQNGLKLMLLLEVISGEALPRPDRGKMRFHNIANVNKALAYIESKGVKLVSIGAEEIVDGNVKMTLGLIWTIILRFAIQDISVGELSARDGLLLWCQRKTAPYDNVNVQNFNTSWKDGLALCALIHRHRPELIDYSKLSKGDPIHNLNLAFDIAEKHLDIPKMLDAEDVAYSIKPDEKSIMTYVSCFYHAFQNQPKAETAANRISRVLRTNQDNEKLMQDYENLASDLLNWIQRWNPWLSNRSTDLTLDDVRKKLDDFRQYRTHEKPPRIDEKGKLETLFNTLQTRLRLSNRPAFMPSNGHLIKDINGAWKGLEQSEKGFEDWLISEMIRLEQLEHLAEKFRRKCELYDEWVAGKESYLRSTDYRSSNVYAIKALRKRHEAFESDLSAHEERVQQISSICKQLNEMHYSKIGPINDKCQSIVDQWNRLNSLSVERRQRLEEAEQITERLDNLHLDFAKRVSPFNNWIDSVREDLVDLLIVHDMNTIEQLLSTHNHFKSTMPDAEQGFEALKEYERQAAAIIDQHGFDRSLLKNPYTDLSTSTISRKWHEVLELIPRRDAALQQELNKQRQNERFRHTFKEKADHLGPWLEDQLGKAINIGLDSRIASLEQTIGQLKHIQQQTYENKPKIDELEHIHQQMQENFVFDGTGRYTMEALRVGWESLMTTINRVISEIENQILLRDSKGLSEELLNEYRASFVHFDRDRAGLDPEQLKACLISLGQDIRPGVEGDHDLQRILNIVDPNNLGRVTFEALVDFMTRENADADTVEQMINSFRVLAAGKQTITESEVRRELPPQDAEYCLDRLKRFQVGADAYDYTSFSRSLYSH
uniref:Alpha-actinin, sarcomeric n=1 Tax=Panagrellus redivivus TaxID=6233 RepID=A0A7E4VFC1_PANRE